MTPHPKPDIAEPLLRWYRSHGRDLPWRHTTDPYKIWVSEIMLQQTQVDTVIPYYRRWLRRFPTLKKLASAQLQEVLKLWAGLGYYRRAKMMHQAARNILGTSAGFFPHTAEGLRELPGIGRYTAGAIASIAFGEKTPVVDGNVIRVLTRLFAVGEPVDSGRVRERLWEIAGALVPENRPGDFNQALMELGAKVCRPISPDCVHCPLKKNCSAFLRNRTRAYPVRKKRIPAVKLWHAAAVIRDGRRFRVQKQTGRGRWEGLWCFPWWPSRSAMLRALRPMRARLSHFMTVRHAVTRYQITLEVFRGRISKTGRPACLTGFERWLPVERLRLLAMPSPHQKILRALLKNGSEKRAG